MKILNITMIIAIVLIIAGTIAFSLSNNEPEVPVGSDVVTIYSRDDSVLQIDEKIIYIIEGTVQSDITGNVNATDYSDQDYRVTTSEGSEKTKEMIYQFDRLYVTAENGVTEGYYTFRYIDVLPE